MPPLSPFYYLDNFEAVLSTLQARYADLLNGPERAFIEAFVALERCSRALLVRMIMRRGPYFLGSRLRYAEIGDSGEALGPLLALGWVQADPPLTFVELASLLSKAQLIEQGALPPGAARRRKRDLLADAAARDSERRPFCAWCAQGADACYVLTIGSLCERLRWIFFGNFRQGWAEFVLADLGIFLYARPAGAQHARAFASRADIESFVALGRCRELLHADAAAAAAAACLPPQIESGGWLEERRQKLMFALARRYEREGMPSAALELYAQCSFPGARIREVRICERQGAWQEALRLCTTPRRRVGEAEGLLLARAGQRVHRRLGLAMPTRPSPLALNAFELRLARSEESGAVEYQVRDFLACEHGGAETHYVENALINSLFGLLCWAAIFAPVPGAFFHDYHHAPADLMSENFFERRRAEFDACLGLLDSDAYVAAIERCYIEKQGVQSPFVAWGWLDEHLLARALACFPAAHLRKWFEWILRDVTLNRAGFPDLVQFWPAERRYRLIEVKGPGDRLQDNQRRLLEFCTAHHMPVAVCRVRWAN